MAYTHSKHEVIMHPVLTSGAAATTHGGDVALSGATTLVLARWAPAIVPHIVRAVGIALTSNSTLTAARSMLFQHEKPAGTATTSATQIANLVMPTTMSLVSGPQAIYDLATENVEILPGQGVRLIAGDAATQATRGFAVLYVEPRWETQANLASAMVETT